MTRLASSFRSVPDLWHHRVGSTPDTEALRFRVDGRWRSMSWGEAGTRVRAIANGLLSLGVRREQRIAIIAETSVEWVLADFGVSCAGAATATAFPGTSDADLRYVLNDAEAVVVFVDGDEQVARLRRLRGQIPSVQRVVVFDPAPTGADDPFVMSLAELEQRGLDHGAAQPEAYLRAHRAVSPGQLATLMYTSGTTGVPKGVMLSHEACVWTSEAVDALGFLHPADVQLLWLPLAHVLARVMELTFVRLGIPTVVDGSSDGLVQNLLETRPTWFAGVPRTFDKARDALLAEIAEQDPVRRRLSTWALDVGKRFAAAQRSGSPGSDPGGRSDRPAGVALRAQRDLADRLVLAPIRARWGGRLRFMICGGAPLSPETGELFDGLGIPILEGYGLTESAGATCVNRLDENRLGTVGRPLPGCRVRIADDGEILVHSPGLMSGYWRCPEETAAAFTEDRFLRTGDVGRLLSSGHLQITGRKKEILVTAGGKNVAPVHFETLLRSRCPFVSHVVMHGDRRPFCSALITLDAEAVARWARDNEVDAVEPWGRPEVHELVQGYVEAANRELPVWEHVRRFAILPEDFTLENGLLTPSAKVRRQEVEARYRNLLDSFYEGRSGRRVSA